MVRMDPKTASSRSADSTGNAAAGALSELFRADLTTATVVCRRCGLRGVFAEVVAELDDDGLIVLCRGCRHTLFTYVHAGAGPALAVDALATLEFPTDPPRPGGTA